LRPVLFMLLINQISPFFLNPLPLSKQKLIALWRPVQTIFKALIILMLMNY
jgi:hypothetical protein